MNSIDDHDDVEIEYSTERLPPLWLQVLCRVCHSRGPETGRTCNPCRWEWTEPGDSSSADTARYRNNPNSEAYDREWWLTLVDSLEDVAADYSGPVVYIARDADGTGPVKIGFSKNPEKRLKDLQASSPRKLTFLRLVQGDRDLEKDIHRYLVAHRSHGEWFNVSGEVGEILP